MFQMTIATAALAFATAASANSSAVIVEASPSVRVAYTDLDLRFPSDRTRLAGRIESAANSLCRQNNVEPLDVKLQQFDCYRIAVASGIRQMAAIAAR